MGKEGERDRKGWEGKGKLTVMRSSADWLWPA